MWPVTVAVMWPVTVAVMWTAAVSNRPKKQYVPYVIS
jgi:hypothetical protein